MRGRTITVAGMALSILLASSMASRAADPAQYSSKAVMLKQDMRKLWTDHVVWTRGYIVAALGDQPDAQAALNRLMKNQEDIGQAVATVYGAAAGTQLTALLKEHIAIAGDLVKAAKTGNKAAQQQADAKWHQNATQIVDSSTRRIRPTGRA